MRQKTSILTSKFDILRFNGFCLLLLSLWESVVVLCFVVRYFMSILVLQSFWWGRGGWLLCLVCLPGLVVVGQLFLVVLRVCLQFVIVVFPYHTYLLFLIIKWSIDKV